MKVFQTCGLAMLVMAAVVGGIAPAAEAAGAIAIGDCDGHGFAYNHRSYGAARANEVSAKTLQRVYDSMGFLRKRP